MSEYSSFAQFYDNLTQNVEYDKRVKYIKEFLYNKKITKGTILDLACGTGSMSLPFLRDGYRIIGLDSSANMLEIASRKFLELSDDFSLVKGDMRSFKLSNTANACICCLDSINHIDNIDDVQNCFQCVFDSLKNNSLFIFDVNTVYKHNHVLSGNTFVFDEEDYYVVWDNENEGNDTIRILLDIFVFNGSSYDRYNEEFFEKAYTVKDLISVLSKTGFKNICVYDDMSNNAPREDSERIYFICEKGE